MADVTPLKLISVIIPVYNTASLIERCISSLLNQTYSNWEAILVDDGSADESLKICTALAEKHGQLRVISQKHQGVSAARNTGVRQARGDFIAFIDADDYADAHMLESLVGWLAQSDADIAACGYYLIRDNTVSTPARPAGSKMLAGSDALIGAMQRHYYQGFLWNKLFRAKLFATGRLWFCEEVSVLEDLLFIIGLLKQGAVIYYDNRPLYYYCVRTASLTESIGGPERQTELIARQMILNTLAEVGGSALNMAQCMYSESAVNLLYGANLLNSDLAGYYKSEAKKYKALYYSNIHISHFEKMRFMAKFYFPKTSVRALKFLRKAKIALKSSQKD